MSIFILDVCVYTYLAVPKISFTVPDSSRAMERDRIERAMLMMSSRVKFPLCLMFFSWYMRMEKGGSVSVLRFLFS